MSSLSVAFVGSRNPLSEEQLRLVSRLLSNAARLGFTWLRHGYGRGSDVDADGVAKTVKMLRDAHPARDTFERDKANVADVDRLRIDDYPTRRLHTFVSLSSLVIAAPAHQVQDRSEAWEAVRLSRRLMIPAYVIFTNGVLQHENRYRPGQTPFYL